MLEKKKKNGGNEDSKKKERHIVTWTQQEDDILRQQISLHGTENWGIIASKFKDKTTRQCRRRWYTYLNSDFKKGGWSPEEDILLCKAQKIFGNRWTEIAKVVSGRTDNAVKNRFSTLCKKRAKYEALAKENKNPCMNSNNIQVIFNNGFNADSMAENEAPVKKMRRSNVPDSSENCYYGNRSHLRSRNQQPRTPFAVLAQDIHNDNMTVKNCVSASKEIAVDVYSASENRKTRGMFLKKDDPKITALMQQAELLSSLALKVNTENTDQSLENAWEIVQDYLNQSKESDFPGHKISDFDFQFEDFKDLIEDLRSCSNGCLSSWRQPDLYKESPTSTEYSTGSTRTPYKAPDKTEHTQAEIPARQEDVGIKSQSIHTEERIHVGECEKEITSNEHITKAEILPSCEEQINNDTVISASSSTEFGSPRQVIPLFRSLAAGIPSPKFSESERKFLLKTLGVESPSPNPSSNSSQQPSCKRALLQSL